MITAWCFSPGQRISVRAEAVSAPDPPNISELHSPAGAEGGVIVAADANDGKRVMQIVPATAAAHARIDSLNTPSPFRIVRGCFAFGSSCVASFSSARRLLEGTPHP